MWLAERTILHKKIVGRKVLKVGTEENTHVLKLRTWPGFEVLALFVDKAFSTKLFFELIINLISC